ncbi:hypothetical protein L2252_13520 [Mesorhizobium muleiense]|nr:hypothetical protein [Mesorhizobium muleiense]MCF6100421.1 hypothetical protein [Mesorhizobium muleiense]
MTMLLLLAGDAVRPIEARWFAEHSVFDLQAAVVPMPSMAQPGYLQTVTDPVFGTAFTRVTDPGYDMGEGMACSKEYCRHRYSSTHAWNADQSFLLIANGCSGMCFLDGRTYQPLFHRPMDEDCKWHPTNAAVMICVYADRVTLWSPRDDVHSVVYRPTNYTDLQFGPYKGNLSNDGRRLVLRARNASGELVAFPYDIEKRSKFPDLFLGSLPGKNGYCGISASGRFVVCFQTLPTGTETVHVFTEGGREVQVWEEHHRPGHGDMIVDEDGRDVYIGISKANPDKWHVIKRRLDDGKVTDLTPPGYATHASVRNVARPGWVFLSYEGSLAQVADNPGWAPFYQEIVALRTDGSGKVRRIVHTYNSRSDYYSESHASPSPDGSQVIWSSNWGRPGSPVAAYVATITWP